MADTSEQKAATGSVNIPQTPPPGEQQKAAPQAAAPQAEEKPGIGKRIAMQAKNVACMPIRFWHVGVAAGTWGVYQGIRYGLKNKVRLWSLGGPDLEGEAYKKILKAK